MSLIPTRETRMYTFHTPREVRMYTVHTHPGRHMYTLIPTREAYVHLSYPPGRLIVLLSHPGRLIVLLSHPGRLYLLHIPTREAIPPPYTHQGG